MIKSQPLVSTAQAETYMRCDQTGLRVTRRPLGAADWRGRLLHSDDAGTLRQNAAELLLKARLMSVGNLTLTAIGCVNLHSYWAFPKFNICWANTRGLPQYIVDSREAGCVNKGGFYPTLATK